AQVGLQALDPRRHVGLHAVQAVGGPGHPAGLGHRLEQRQVGQLQAAFSDRDGIVHNDSFYVLARLRQAGRWRCAMPLATVLTERLGLSHPIVQAPLAGGGDTPALVAAVAEAGALGFIGAAYLTPTQVAEAARPVRAHTRRPFGINLFAPVAPAPPARGPAAALARVAPFYDELGLPRPALPPAPPDAFADQLAAALESGAAVFSFTFGVLPAAALDAVKARGMFVMGTASTVEEALALARARVDA